MNPFLPCSGNHLLGIHRHALVAVGHIAGHLAASDVFHNSAHSVRIALGIHVPPAVVVAASVNETPPAFLCGIHVEYRL